MPCIHVVTHEDTINFVYLVKRSTPVMLAAGKGHTGVVDLLVHKYNCSLTEVDTVCDFTTVLRC